ncbi:hypothetical protein NIES21_43300 [Anabaenopsis circularis NIES-21]|uniref:POLO box domain-containing protein n=2 Tax=Nostocales TaxID=1161 RepID=A0A1Z4GLV3_9CYAN|nr:hypothetical protein [Nostoc cycadae]BAY18483.1 hypothetical protein NIES21_43300 [Anabaenopsis circularis NIES-21]GBE90460.1 hypothetical protein NCWK1_0176 [Nostoc cycadae WK-1]
MSNLFSQKISLSLGTAALLTAIFAHGYFSSPSKNPELAQPENIQDNFALSQPQISLASMQTASVNQPILEQVSDKYAASVSVGYPVIDEWKNYKFSINGNQILSTAKLPTSKINFNQSDLLSTLVNTRQYFQDHAADDPDIQRKGLLGTQGVSVEDVLKTLDFMIVVLKEDIANNRPTRLQEPNFINKNFRVIKWNAYNKQNTSQKQLRITKYAVFTHQGSPTKTAKFNTPIYSLKDSSYKDKFYTKYTKQDVLSGIYEPGGKEFGKVQPLAYLTRDGLEEALLQGTILIKFTDGSQAFFNVDRNNGMSYIRGLKGTAQKRYWYFKKVDAIKGYGHKIDAKISIKPGVTFAGDVLNIGVGKVVVIENNQGGRKNLRMGVIADTGGAFLPNLYQLDFLAGIFQNRQEFGQYIQQLPEYATAYFLVKK